MKRFLAFILLSAASAFGANGDVVSATVDANGYSIQPVYQGLNTGGASTLGFGTLNTPSANNGYLSVTTQGYDSTGAIVARTRKVLITSEMRKPYNQDANKDEAYSNPNLTKRYSLSAAIFQKDSTNLTVTMPSGFYAQGGTNSTTTTALSVTDNSTLALPATIGNWCQPNWDVITSSSFKVYFEAYNRFGISGVKFTAADTHSHTVTVTVTVPTLDDRPGWSGGIRPSCYMATIDASTLTQGDTITVNAIAYPFIGDSGSVLDTSDAANTMPTPLYAPLTFLNNKSGTIVTCYAAVDPTNGSDTTGVVKTNGWSSANPFQTIAGAGRALVNTNNAVYLRNHLGLCFIGLTNANHAWVGASYGYGSYGNTPDTWTTIANYPSGSGATINSQSGNFHLQNGSNGKLHFSGITFSGVAGDTFDNCGYVWIDGCVLNSNSDGVFDANLLSYYTFNTIGASGWNGGFTSYSTHNNPCALAMGNNLTGMKTTGNRQMVYHWYGNYCAPNSVNAYTMGSTIGSTAAPAATRAIFSFNWLSTTNFGGTFLSWYNTDANSVGAALVNNVFELSSDVGQTTVVAVIGGDSSTSDPVSNLLIWGNTIVGSRWNNAYNDQSAVAPVRRLWSVWGNLLDEHATKHDTFTGGGGANAVRTNGWSYLYSVGHSKNVDIEVTGYNGTGSFLHEFAGLNSDQPALLATQPPSGTARAATYLKYVNRLAYDGSSAGSGGGNYRVQSSSPAVLLDDDFCPLLFDIEGNYRGKFDPPGAYVSASPRRGGGFF